MQRLTCSLERIALHSESGRSRELGVITDPSDMAWLLLETAVEAALVVDEAAKTRVRLGRMLKPM